MRVIPHLIAGYLVTFGIIGIALGVDSSQKVIDACEGAFEKNKADCSGFVRDVLSSLKVPMAGDANDLIAAMEKAGSGWSKLASGAQAKDKADAGWLVVGGLRGAQHTPSETHGHVVVVVKGPLKDKKYPTAYWGRLGGVGSKNSFVTKAWKAVDLDKVEYFARQIP